MARRGVVAGDSAHADQAYVRLVRALSLIPDMNEASLRETQDWAELERIGTVAKHPSDAQRERIMAALARARQDNELLTFLTQFFVRYPSAAGVTMPNTERPAAVQAPFRVAGLLIRYRAALIRSAAARVQGILFFRPCRSEC